MKLFRCTWANGEVSFCSASSKAKALRAFDEVGEADPDAIDEIDTEGFMFTLAPVAEGEDVDWELSELGGAFDEDALSDIEETQLARAEKS